MSATSISKPARRTSLALVASSTLALFACGSGAQSQAGVATAGVGQEPIEGEAGGSAIPGGGTGNPGAAGAGNTNTGGKTSAGGSDPGAGNGTSISCKPDPGLTPDAPRLSTTEWTQISPAGFPFSDNTDATGFAFSPCNPSVLYLCMGAFDPANEGFFRSTNAGKSWSRVGKIPAPMNGGGSQLEGPNHVRVNPADPQHLYVTEGVRGGTQGFWVSHDGGDTFAMPSSFANLGKANGGIFINDVYDIAVDPTNFNHILLSHHFGWGAQFVGDSGILESSDGGTTWIVHEPKTGWGTGHAINFLYQPEQGIGNKDTWLLGTQGNGFWRTSDAGKTWTQVTTNALQHGGGTIYYDKAGTLYASGTPNNIRSTDNGLHWTTINAPQGYTAIYGDGKLVYTRPCFNMGPFLTTPEGGDGMTWTDFGTQQFERGPFEMSRDKTNGILYSSNWHSGLWALKVD